MALALVLAGCSTGSDSPEATAEPTSTPMATPFATPESVLSLGAVIWTTAEAEDSEPGEGLSEIPRGADVIRASANVDNAPAGTQLVATWTIDGLPVEGMSETVVVEAGAASGWVSFSLTWESAAFWPVGQLGVTITADTGEVTTGTVTIVST